MLSNKTAMPQPKAEFTGLRKILWPVHNHELKKVLSLALMMLFILFNYNVLRDTKDGLIITAPGAGAESINFLKLYGSLTMVVAVMMLYSKLSLILTKQKLFYSMMGIFVASFIVFGFVLFPLKDLLHAAPETITSWQAAYPRLHWVIPLFGNWTYSLFYILAELWGSVGLSVLFWQLANDINTIEESKRFYPMFGVISSFGIILSGYFLYEVTEIYNYLSPAESWSHSIEWIVNGLLVSMTCILCIYHWIQKHIAKDIPGYNSHKVTPVKSKKKLSFKDSMKVVFESRYIALIMSIIVCYAICLNLVEVTWKSQMKLQFPDTSDYVKTMGLISMSKGFITIFLMILGGNILRRFGWFTTAVMTPLILLISGSVFFSCIIFQDYYSGLLTMLNTTPLFLVVLIGWVQNTITKSVKYSMFDPTKEMAYIPLEDGLKTRGKAAADGIGGRLGKSGGAMIQQVLLVSIVGSTQLTLTPIIAVIFLIVASIWLYSVVKLNREFTALAHEQATGEKVTEEQEIEDIDAISDIDTIMIKQEPGAIKTA